ncbi:MAG: hypothetical protein WCZ89_06205 [Phycisphaerae bacterium]
MTIPDSNYPGAGVLTLYKRDGLTVLAEQDANETTTTHTRGSVWD